jgi:MGT family glycosyltransferase
MLAGSSSDRGSAAEAVLGFDLLSPTYKTRSAVDSARKKLSERASNMARVLFCMPPLTGHINPAREVAQELQLRGHEVAWAIAVEHRNAVPEIDALPGRIYPLPIAGSADLARASGEVRGLESVRFFYEEFCLPLALATEPLLGRVLDEFQPELMICDQQMLSGALIARKRGLPWLTSATTSASVIRMSPMLDAWIEQQFSNLQVAAGIAQPVARPDMSPYGVIIFSSPELVGNERLRVDTDYHFVGPAFSQRVNGTEFPWDRLQSSRVKILITLGTISRDRGLRFFDIMMEALRDGALRQAVQVIMVAPSSVAGVAPDNFIVCERVPQITLLEHMDAVICHAGHNTVCEALAFGLPLIVAPIRDDQPVIARQVIAAGAALPMRFGKISVALAREKVTRLLADASLRDRARRLGASLRSLGGARRAADIVEARWLEASLVESSLVNLSPIDAVELG